MIPISTDAPIYHYPIATVATIVLNILVFLALPNPTQHSRVQLNLNDPKVLREFQDENGQLDNEKLREALLKLDPDEVAWTRSLCIEFGKVRPWQWFTNNFLHADIFHLLGNMVFLWSFGLIVEGKVGWFLFMLIYAGIGTFYGMVLQLGSLPFVDMGIALGASAAIFGLLALCVIWAPANEFTCFWYYQTWEISILYFCGFKVIWEIAMLMISQFAMGSEMLHIIGFLVGFPVGVILLRTGMVDCEGWDLFSYLSHKTGHESEMLQRSNSRRQQAEATKQALLEERRVRTDTAMHSQVSEAIEAGEYLMAAKLQFRLQAANPSLGWRQQDLYRIIGGLLKQKQYDFARPLMNRYLEIFHENQFAIQAALIQIHLDQGNQREAADVVHSINEAFLDEQERAKFAKLKQRVF